MAWQYEIDRNDLRTDRIERNPVKRSDRARVLQFALTANVVTYALTGGRFGYWKLFPTEAPWIVPPAWGEAALADGSIAFGLVPTGSHVPLDLAPTTSGWRETSAHRASIDPGYNRYVPASGSLRERENALLFRPLVVLGLVLERWLREEGWFEASRVLVSSASSKSALGYAMQHRNGPPLHALTGAANRTFVERTRLYESVFIYDDPPPIAANTLILDFTGDSALVNRLRDRKNDRIPIVRIGATYAHSASLEGDTVFFAPKRIGQEIAVHGLEAFERDRSAAIARFEKHSTDWFSREYVDGPDAICHAFRDLLANRVSPDRLLIARPRGGGFE